MILVMENGSFDRFRRQEGYLVKGSEKGVITYLQILLPVLLCGAVSILLAWIIDRMVVDVIMGYRHFKKSMIE